MNLSPRTSDPLTQFKQNNNCDVLDLSIKKSNSHVSTATENCEVDAMGFPASRVVMQPMQEEPIDFSTKSRQISHRNDACLHKSAAGSEARDSRVNSWHIPACFDTNNDTTLSMTRDTTISSEHDTAMSTEHNTALEQEHSMLSQSNDTNASNSVNFSSHNSNHASTNHAQVKTGDLDSKSRDPGIESDVSEKISVNEAAAVLMDMSLSLATPPATPVMADNSRYGCRCAQLLSCVYLAQFDCIVIFCHGYRVSRHHITCSNFT